VLLPLLIVIWSQHIWITALLLILLLLFKLHFLYLFYLLQQYAHWILICHLFIRYLWSIYYIIFLIVEICINIRGGIAWLLMDQRMGYIRWKIIIIIFWIFIILLVELRVLLLVCFIILLASLRLVLIRIRMLIYFLIFFLCIRRSCR